MPGKKKPQRKPEHKGGKSSKKNTLVERGTKSHKGQPRNSGTPQTAKRFTLKDEAAKSTAQSSKRLWQGDGQKLRNLPVVFVKALEAYDPGQFLREQLEASALRAAGMQGIQIDPAASGGAPIEAHDEPIQGIESCYNGVIETTSAQLPAALVSASSESETDDADPELGSQSDDAFTKAADEYMASDSDASQAKLRAHPESRSTPHEPIAEEAPKRYDPIIELEVSSAVNDLHLSPPRIASPKANIDLVLEALDTTISASNRTCDIEESTDLDMSVEHQSTLSDEDDMQLFVIDTEGDRNQDGLPSPPYETHLEELVEKIVFLPRSKTHQVPVSTGGSGVSIFPCARTIDDPVYVSETHDDVARSPTTIGHAFEQSASKSRGKRGGRKKKDKSRAHGKSARRGDFGIMFDYMENAKWTDTDSDEDSIKEGEENEDAEPLINQLLAGLGPQPHTTRDSLDELEGASSSASDEEDDSNDDDSDIDDDLELMIDAEMEELAFDIGYSRGKGTQGRRFGADRELVDSVLYHEDFNVYDYASSDGELDASGANKRGLNKFINDLDLSDEELEAALIAQWQKDRGSKKAKKRERQRLHQDGLIGKKAKRARASHEIGKIGETELDSIHEHIKRFVTHQDYVGIEELPMPAMEKPVRRAAHLISQVYGLKSASQGSGKRRYITFYKTKHASPPDVDFLEDTMVRARRTLGFNSKHRDRLLPDAARQKLGRSGRPMRPGKSGGAGGAGRLRDGDVVGADAPEIASQNRGRQMLEKLGWLHGSGLGAIGNQGMNIPLFATIKNSKAGL